MDYEKKYRESLKKAEAFYYSATTEPITEREVLANIFPELKESDDEKIRKEIISALKNANYKGVYDKHLAWLEKQGDKPFDYENANIQQKDFAPKLEPKFKVGDRVNKNDREDEEHCILTITSVNIDEHCYICNQCSVIDFGEQDLWHIVKQKPAWSEEDEIGLIDALWAIKQARTIVKDENDMGNLWYAEDWLKSLKDRYTWKPSDEQMDNLSRAFNGANYRTSLLRDLYLDLKKLKGD